MARSTGRVLLALGVSGGFLLGAPTGAGADVIDPSGACNAAGTWEGDGVTRRSVDLAPDEVIAIPQEDTVLWSGDVGGEEPAAEGPRRENSGEVEVDIAGIGSAEIDSWGRNSSVRYANEGEHDYDVPDVLLNVRVKLRGAHREAPEGSRAFEEVCHGSVYVQVQAGLFENPLTLAAIASFVVFGAGLVSAGPRLGIVCGLLFGLSVAVLLLTTGVIPLDSVLLVALPVLFLLVGAGLAAVARFQRGRLENPPAA